MADQLAIVEGRAGTWFYHLSRDAKGLTSLCGALTMPTEIPLRAWGSVGHLRERYCKECATLGGLDVCIARLEELGSLTDGMDESEIPAPPTSTETP